MLVHGGELVRRQWRMLPKPEFARAHEDTYLLELN